MNWIQCSERLPEDGERVLFTENASTIYLGQHIKSVPQWNGDGLFFHGDTGYRNITHWMPLPEPPEPM